jgi:hypothetical protein
VNRPEQNKSAYAQARFLLSDIFAHILRTHVAGYESTIEKSDKDEVIHVIGGVDLHKFISSSFTS